MIPKSRIKRLVEERSFDEIGGLALQDRRVISTLISLTYDKESVTTWRAIEALGIAARVIAKEDVLAVRDTIRRLLWMMTDESGGIGWSAPEMLGEIIRTDPEEFSDIIPILWSYREEEIFREGAVCGMSRVAEVRPDLAGFVGEDLPALLQDGSPLVRGYAARLAGFLGPGPFREEVAALRADGDLIPVYRDGELVTMSIGDVAREALEDKNSK